MTAHRKDPYRRVVAAHLQDGSPGRLWILKLECGHEDARPVKYACRIGVARGGDRRRPVRSLKDLAPAPQKVMCDLCDGVA